MFDALPGPGELADMDDAALISAITGWARASAAAEARKLTVLAELVRRRCEDGQHQSWACDDWDAAAAEVACALTIGHGRAVGQLDLAVTLRDRLPAVGRRFLAGEISPAMISTLAWRTALVVDEDALARLDAALAERAAEWGVLSRYKLEQAIDIWVDRFDPDAVRRTRNRLRDRSFTVGDRDDAQGTTSVYGRLNNADAALLEQRLTAMTTGVCDDDPRTLAQRRADSIGALGAGATHLACRCGDPRCPAAVDDGRASSVIVHVVAEEKSLDTPRDALLDGDALPEPAAPPGPAPASADHAKATSRRGAALIPGLGGGILPAPLLADLIANGANVVTVDPTRVGAENRYRPSAALQRFVRARDLTCRFPGCDRAAASADIDHTEPWPAGATHPGNLKCFCRLHHLLKTFWAGWRDVQRPDGTLTVTSPSGHTYTTKPFAALLFPAWRTAAPPPPRNTVHAAQVISGRELMMPTRRRTRAATRRARISAERKANRALISGDGDPPPF